MVLLHPCGVWIKTNSVTNNGQESVMINVCEPWTVASCDEVKRVWAGSLYTHGFTNISVNTLINWTRKQKGKMSLVKKDPTRDEVRFFRTKAKFSHFKSFASLQDVIKTILMKSSSVSYKSVWIFFFKVIIVLFILIRNNCFSWAVLARCIEITERNL